MPRMTIDGAMAEAPEGSTVLEVARAAGVEIPTFCHHDALRPLAACRLCVVEVEGPGLPRTVLTACSLPASEGLVVETSTPRLQLYRTTIVQLLLASLAPSDRLAALGRRFGVTTPAFRNEQPDPCALCGLCVRACRDRIGAAAIAFRGDGVRPSSVAERIALEPAQCVGCGTCASLCPLGAIAVEDRDLQRTVSVYGEVAARFDLLPCPACGTPTTTERFRDLVLSRLDEAERAALPELCPRCARDQRARALTGDALALEG